MASRAAWTTRPEAKVVVDGLDPQKQPATSGNFSRSGPTVSCITTSARRQHRHAILLPGVDFAGRSRTGIIENYVQGVRNSVGFDWHPQTKQLWFTNHGRDWLGDESPNDTLHVATRKGQHFGYPYCHQGDTLDPEFGRTATARSSRRRH